MKSTVTVLVKDYPDGGVPVGAERVMEVRSHWNYRDRVVLVLGDQVFTAIASQLHKAIDNACNH